MVVIVGVRWGWRRRSVVSSATRGKTGENITMAKNSRRQFWIGVPVSSSRARAGQALNAVKVLLSLPALSRCASSHTRSPTSLQALSAGALMR